MYFDDHKRTIQATIKMVPAKSPEEVTMIRIGNTLEMDTIWISENLIEEAKKIPEIEILSEAKELVFDQNGNLFE